MDSLDRRIASCFSGHNVSFGNVVRLRCLFIQVASEQQQPANATFLFRRLKLYLEDCPFESPPCLVSPPFHVTIVWLNDAAGCMSVLQPSPDNMWESHWPQWRAWIHAPHPYISTVFAVPWHFQWNLSRAAHPLSQPDVTGISEHPFYTSPQYSSEYNTPHHILTRLKYP